MASDLAGKNNAEVSQMLRGQAGTSFKLKVNRPNAKEEYTDGIYDCT